MYYLLHRNQLHFSAIFMAIFRLTMRNVIGNYTRFACVVYSVEVKGEVGTRSPMRCVGWVVGSGTFHSRLIYENMS
jgi:hypothetical protein